MTNAIEPEAPGTAPLADVPLGTFDGIERGRVAGWAADPTAPEQRIEVAVFADGELVATGLADSFRPDLHQAGIGDGRHAFWIDLPPQLLDGSEHTIDVCEATSGKRLRGSPKVLSSHEAMPSGGARTTFDRFLGPVAAGWAIGPDGEPAKALDVRFGGKLLGRIRTTVPRADVKQALALDSELVGYRAMLGGLLHFAAVSQACRQLVLSQPGQVGERLVQLHEALPEALTFSPLKAFDRRTGKAALGAIRGLRYRAELDVSLLFEAATNGSTDAAAAVSLELYQELPGHPAGALKRLARFAIALDGQVTALDFSLQSSTAPVLLVATQNGSDIVLTDCLPLPELFAPRHALLVDYHGSLSSSSTAVDDVAKLSRNFIDDAARRQLSPNATAAGPIRANTAVLVFTRDHADVPPESTAAAFAHVADAAPAILLRDGRVHVDGALLPLADYLDALTARYLLLAESRTVLRPDFWAIVGKFGHQVTADTELVYWNSIVVDGADRPCLVKRRLLLDEVFRSHPLMEADACIAGVDSVKRVAAELGQQFRSGSLAIEHAFARIDEGRTAHLPVVLDSRQLDLRPLIKDKLRSEHVPVDSAAPLAAPSRSSSGVSVIINYRDGVEETLRCLDALRLQQFDGAIEIVLVNNASLPDSVRTIVSHAVALFGQDAVVPLDYSAAFNHSAQSNLGATAARQDLLVMLSNDALFITPDALAKARDIAELPWVATCGFRVIGRRNGKTQLQSMGLGLNPRGNLMQGGSPLVSHHPPPFALDRTIEVAGNTFAAVMVRRDLYLGLGGLDAAAFPIAYNDVDFCLRATASGRRHVVVGSAIVDHLAHGSREMDLDLPIDARIIDRLPPVAVLTRVGFQSL